MQHILVIDDEPAIRTLLRNYLQEEGYAICLAQDGRHALRLCVDYQADLIITDVFMPDQDGLEVIMTMRQRRPGLPIIAMSGGGRMDKRDVLHIAKSTSSPTAKRKTKPKRSKPISPSRTSISPASSATSRAASFPNRSATRPIRSTS